MGKNLANLLRRRAKFLALQIRPWIHVTPPPLDLFDKQPQSLFDLTGALKMTDVKMTDQMSRHKTDGHENGGQI